MDGERFQATATALALRGDGLDHRAAADRARRRVRANDESVPARGDRGFLEKHLRQRRSAGLERCALEQYQPADDLAGAQVESHAGRGLPLARVVGQEFETDVEDGRGAQRPRRHQPVAACDFVLVDPVQGQRRALAGARLLHRGAVHLHAPDAHSLAAGEQLDRVAGAHDAAP